MQELGACLMDFVEPIRDRRKVANIKNMMHGQGRFRDLLLITIGVNTALRVSDLLLIRIGQLVSDGGEIAEPFTIREEKRGKRNVIFINDSIRHALTVYLAAYPTIVADPDNFVSSTRERTTTASQSRANRYGRSSPSYARMWD